MFQSSIFASVLLWIGATNTNTFPSASNSSSSLLYALVGGIATGACVLILGIIKEARRGKQDTSKVIAEATQSAVTASKEMIVEYRVELENVRKDLSDTRNELITSRKRIYDLEQSLKIAKSGRNFIEQELFKVKNQLKNSEDKLETLKRRIAELELVAESPTQPNL